jgi:GNAT superfamily N-acetyltransferase
LPACGQRMIDIALRPLRADDEPLVYDAWIKTAWEYWQRQTSRCSSCGARFTFIGKDSFCDGMSARICRLLVHGLGVAITTPGKVGFLIRHAELPALHFLYVVERWRGMGVATAAMERLFPGFPEAEMVYTQDTQAMPVLRKRWNAKFNPFLAEG